MRSVKRSRSRNRTSKTVMAEKDGTWITLLTCGDYSEKTDRYAYRRVVQAVLIEVK